jgi:hypothetical protein
MKKITDTFVLVAPDCSVTAAVVPAAKRAATSVAVVQHELLIARPYTLTLEDLIFEVHVRRAGVSRAEAKSRAAAIRAELFARPQACMRTSPLPKRYGWGVHYDERGRLALYAMESEEYRHFAEGKVDGVKVEVALRSKRA